MAEVLSQEEINALLAQFAANSEEPAEPLEATPEGRTYKLYDFKRPNRFSREQLRTIHMLHETFARHLSSTLSAHLRTPVKVTLCEVQQRIYDEYLSALKAPAVMYLFTPEPLEGQAILEFNPYIVFIMIDRLMGGPGRVKGRIRELTEIEENLVRAMVDRTMEDLKEAWDTMVKMHPHIDKYESNPQFAQLVSPNDTVCLITFELKVGEASGGMSICMPHSTLQPVLQRLSTQHWYQKGNRVNPEKGSQNLSAGMEQVQIPVAAVLGHAEVSMRDMVDLQVGDVIRLQERASGNLTLVIGKTPKFHVIPGLTGKNHAVQVVELVDSDEK